MAKIACNCGAPLSHPSPADGSVAKCPECGAAYRCISSEISTAGPAEIDAQLLIERGPERVGEQIFLSGPGAIAIGKSAERPLRLIAPLVSRHHCTLIGEPRGWRIEDHTSTNGLFVNGQRVQSRELNDGDVIRVGDFELSFHALRNGEPAIENGGAEAVEEIDDLSLESWPPTTNPEPSPQPVAVASTRETEYMLVASGRARATSPTRPPPGEFSNAMQGPVCPSCGNTLGFAAKICVACGINVKTGKSIQIRQGIDLNVLYGNVASLSRIVSIFLPIGLFPIASEAFGNFKPYAIRTIALLTTVITVAVWIADYNKPGAGDALMLWSGDQPSADLIAAEYRGNDPASAALHQKIRELANHEGKATMLSNGSNPNRETDLRAIIVEAYNQLPPEDQKLGQFHFYQLLTNAFLHGGIMHLVGNLIFLLVFGNRVNAMLGQWKATAAYLLLAILASLVFLISQAGQPLTPALGASGAIMGLAGIYFVLMPVSRVYMVAWLRLGLLTGFRRIFKIFSLRGFWVLLFYLAFDVWATIQGSRDGTAHWAHLGGFICGMIVGLVLLLTRQVNAMGGDILSVVLGKNAWKLIGTPAERMASI